MRKVSTALIPQLLAGAEAQIGLRVHKIFYTKESLESQGIYVPSFKAAIEALGMSDMIIEEGTEKAPEEYELFSEAEFDETERGF